LVLFFFLLKGIGVTRIGGISLKGGSIIFKGMVSGQKGFKGGLLGTYSHYHFFLLDLPGLFFS